jgi:hypothetical protein
VGDSLTTNLNTSTNSLSSLIGNELTVNTSLNTGFLSTAQLNAASQLSYMSSVTTNTYQSVLGFIAQDVSNYFPKAVQVTSNLGFLGLLLIDPYQVQVLHYGATRHLMIMNERHQREVSSFYTSTLANASKYVNSVAETFITLKQGYSQLTTLMATESTQRYEAYESTITGHFVTISTLTAHYDRLSTLIGERVSTITESEQVPSQPPQEEV